MKPFFLCVIQPKVIPLEIDKNLDHCVRLVNKILKFGMVDLIVFPETVTTGFSIMKFGDKNFAIKKLYIELKQKFTFIKQTIGKLAKDNNVNIIFPTYISAKEKNKFYNCALFFDNDGNLKEIYRKIFLFPTESWSISGYKPVIWKTKFVKVGCMICFDGDYPELSRWYALNGVELIVRPAALLRDYTIWSNMNVSRAYENQVYFCAVNSIGSDYAEKNFYGHSMLINPYGKILKQLGASEEFFITKLEPKNMIDTSNIIVLDHIKELRKARWRL